MEDNFLEEIAKTETPDEVDSWESYFVDFYGGRTKVPDCLSDAIDKRYDHFDKLGMMEEGY